MTDHANELRRHARKIPHPQGETPGVMLRAADEIERLQRVIASPHSMTRDDVIRMAREAGLLIPSFRIDGGLALGACTVPDFERFASLVAAAEREERAQLVEKNADVCGPNTMLCDAPRVPDDGFKRGVECAVAFVARKAELYSIRFGDDDARRHIISVLVDELCGLFKVQPAPSVPDATWLPVPDKHPTFDPVDLQLADGSVLCGCVPQSDGDYWWEGPSGEVFIDPRYAPVTHWRLSAAPEAKP